MKIDRKNKAIYLTEKDDKHYIVLINKKLKDAIGIKVLSSSKGFGLEIFSKIKDEHKPKQSLLLFIENKGKPYKAYYRDWETDRKSVV